MAGGFTPVAGWSLEPVARPARDPRKVFTTKKKGRAIGKIAFKLILNHATARCGKAALIVTIRGKQAKDISCALFC